MVWFMPDSQAPGALRFAASARSAGARGLEFCVSGVVQELVPF